MPTYHRRKFLADAARTAALPLLAGSEGQRAHAALERPAEARGDRELMFLPAWKQRELVAGKQVSAVELVEAALRRIEALDGKLHAFITVDRAGALAAAKAADAAVRQGSSRDLGALHGVPVSVKDLDATRGLRTTFGSKVFQDYVPDRDSIVVERLRKAGAVILGKTNTPEFGASAETYNRVAPACNNPWDPTRIAGGSSGGAVVSVAAGMCALATGGDGGGSIRLPCHFSGAYGIKPTLGRVPGWGGMGRPAANQVSVGGPLTRTVRDAAILLQVIAGHDSRDPGSLRARPADFVAALGAGVKGLKVGWSVDLGFAAVDPEIAAAVQEAARTFGSLGAEVAEAGLKLDPPPYEYWWTIWIANRRASYGHIVDEHLQDVMQYTAAIDRYGAQVSAADYSRALRQADRLRDTLGSFFEKFDLLLLPTAAVTAYPHRNPPRTIAGRSLPEVRGGLSFGAIPFTMPFNVAGNPAASVPAGFDKQGLPLGIQLVAHVGNEAAVLRASAAFEEARPWAGKRPPLS